MSAIALILIALSAMAFADTYTYEPDDDGLYSVSLGLEADSEYTLFAIKGKYDQTNYIEAFSAAKDSDIIYFDQKKAPEDGNVSFGPFAPLGYFDATLIIVGTNYEQPRLVGHLSAEGVSNSAKIDIVGVGKKYAVDGAYGSGHVIDIETKVYDSFGYESLSSEKPKITLSGNKDGVWYDEEKKALVIDKNAKEQLFGIVAAIGDTTSVKYAEVVRSEPVVYEIKIFDNESETQPVSLVEVAGKADNFPSITFHVKSYDQFGDEVEDTHSLVFDGRAAQNTVKPTGEGTFTFVASSNSNAAATALVTIKVQGYEENSFALYELIEKCENELALIGTERFVCDENGKSVFAPYTWTTSAKKAALEEALQNAKAELSTYNKENDADFANDVTALKAAYKAYIDSFKTGTRKDVTSIRFKSSSYLYAVSTAWNDLNPITEPRIALTTDKITYTSSDPSVVEINELGEVKAKNNGTVTITATTRSGLVAVCEVTSYHAVTRITLNKTEYTAEYGKADIMADAQINPSYYGDTLEWTLENDELAELVVTKTEDGEAATIIPKKPGKTKIVVTAVNSGISKSSALEVIMPDWETVAKPEVNISGNVQKNTPVTITSQTPDVTIYYTLDGTVPSKTNGRIYTSPIAVSQDLTLSIIAVKDGMFDSQVAVYEYNALDTAVSVTDAVAMAGTKVKVYVNLLDFTDVKSANVEITYDSTSLVLSNAVFAEGASQGDDTASGKFVMNVLGSVSDGTAVTLEFDVAETAEDGSYEVAVAKADVIDINDSTRSTKAQNGVINVRDYILGDANDDGKIGLEDVLVIKQYAAGNASAKKNILFAAADVNGDGVVDKNDSALIAQYCVGLINSFN